VSRYYLGSLVTHLSAASRFPWATLTVNMLGCLVIGILAGAAESRHVLSASTRLFLFTGILGGFTTFSAFGYESFFLARQSWPAAVLNIFLHLVLALPCVWIGHRAATSLLAG
jgi:CrcB protein